ncbi:MAG: metallophosphoesterase family protein [Planctomycetaceae bacterium]
MHRCPPPVGILLVVLAALAAARADEPEPGLRFRVRHYLLDPAADAMTIRWLSETGAAGAVECNGATLTSTPVLARDLDYDGAEPLELQHASPPYLHSVRVTGLEPATSYPYAVTQDGETLKAVLTTAPRRGEVGRGGGVRLFLYGHPAAQPESRGSHAEWPPSPSAPGGPRPTWAKTYPADETTGYRMNLALMASRAAESLRAGNPVLACVVGDLVENGGEQRDWDEFWRHNAGTFGTFASRVPLAAVPGEHDICGGPKSPDPQRNLGGYSGAATLRAARKFAAYFEHPANGAADERHEGRYWRIDFGPVTLLGLDTTNGGSDGGADDTNHLLDRKDAPHIPDYAPGSEQHAWLQRELAAARDRGAITFVAFHHSPWTSGRRGLPPGSGVRFSEHSGIPLRLLGQLFRDHGVRAVFGAHDDMYEHSFADGVHYFDVGIGGDGLRAPHPGLFNDKQIFVADDHAPEAWRGNVLVSGGKHYGHVEVNVDRKADGAGFAVSITPVCVFPILDPRAPGTVTGWERREYDDVLRFDAVAPAAAGNAAGHGGKQP